MKAVELLEKVIKSAESFGCKISKNNGEKGNAILRKNIESTAFTDGKAFFGFINPEEDYSGAYADFSFVVFPQQEDGECIISLGVGSLGFKNDYSLAALPGLRRSYMRLSKNDGKSFIKTSFLDIEEPSKDLLEAVRESYPELRNVIEVYKNVLPASRIINPDIENDYFVLEAWLAKYAEYRAWASNQSQRKNIQKAINRIENIDSVDHEKNVNGLLQKRHFVVLQGAPGTGKTHTALNIANNYDKVFFEQFHAETTYSDFVYGIKPELDSDIIKYTSNKGVLYNSIDYASNHSDEKVLLIIDEINRANLSNVLGPIFYLFEYQSGDRNTSITIGDLTINNFPKNLHVIATMNTADRSLAVVDFALRRRFAWYTLTPQIIGFETGAQKTFHKDLFMRFNSLFDKYATDEELNLQPGQSYFITSVNSAEEEMKDRMIYELMPLMKEYFSEGFLLKAKNEFCQLFYQETNIQMYQ